MIGFRTQERVKIVDPLNELIHGKAGKVIGHTKGAIVSLYIVRLDEGIDIDEEYHTAVNVPCCCIERIRGKDRES